MSKSNSNLNTTQLSQRIIYLKSELAKYKAIVEDYENNYHYSQLRKLKLQNKELREEKESISLQLQELNSHKNEEKNLRHQFQIKSEELNQSLVDQNKKIEDLIKDNNIYQKEISRLKERIEEYKKNNEFLKTKIISINGQLNEKNVELEQVKEDFQKLLLQDINQKESITELQAKNETLYKDLDNLSKENNLYKNESTELSKRIANIEKDKVKIEEILKTQEEKSRVELSNLQKDLLSYKNINEKLRSEINDIVEENIVHKRKLKEAMQNAAITNEEQQRKSKKHLNDLQKKLENAEKKYFDLEQANITLKSSKYLLEQNLKEQQNQNKYIIEKNERLKEENNNNSSIIKLNNELLMKVETIQSSQLQLVTTINSLKKDFASLFSIINNSETENIDVSELLVSILEHQFRKSLENSLLLEDKFELKSNLIHHLENKIAEINNKNELTSNYNTGLELE